MTILHYPQVLNENREQYESVSYTVVMNGHDLANIFVSDGL